MIWFVIVIAVLSCLLFYFKSNTGSEQSSLGADRGNSFEKIKVEIQKFDFRKVQELLAQDRTISDPVQSLIREFKLFFALKAFYKDVHAQMLYPSFKVHRVWHAIIQLSSEYYQLCNAILPADAATRIIDYHPFEAVNAESQVERYNQTLEVYWFHFNKDPPTAFWEPIDQHPPDGHEQNAPATTNEPANSNSPATSNAPVNSNPPANSNSRATSNVRVYSSETMLNSQETFMIRVRTLTQRKFEILVKGSDTVNSLKSKYSANQGLPVANQCLIFNGKQLKDGTKTLSEYNLKEGSVLDMVLPFKAET